jgi:hypothetical protein
MTDMTGPRPGSRDNGLRCGGYAAVADLDPRVADALLDALRSEGIAAYAAPTPGAPGYYMETRLPSRPIDRLWVDDQRLERARELVAAETSEHTEPASEDKDLDTAWQEVLASLRATPSTESGSWPVREDVETPTPYAADGLPSYDDDDGSGDETGESYDPADDEHFVPPPPPPLPRLAPVTVVAVLAILGGVAVLITGFGGGDLNVFAFFAIVAGAVSLVWHMRSGPPTDSGWDDGAVL